MKGLLLVINIRIGNVSLPMHLLRLFVRRSQIDASRSISRLAPQQRPHIESIILPKRRRQLKHKPIATNPAPNASGKSEGA